MTATIKAVTSPDYYVAMATVAYYADGGNSPGRWSGTGAHALRLTGIVGAEDLRHVLAGFDPRSGRRLFQAQKSNKPIEHRAGFDVTFQVPKSVSALWAVSSPERRAAIEAAFDRSVTSVLQWMESQLPLTRRGKGGKYRETAELVLARFNHIQSRNGDPLLHWHVLFGNICLRADGTWGTLDSKTLYSWVRTMGPMLRSTFACELTSLGLTLVDVLDKDGQQRGWFEVEGVSSSLCEDWSSRRTELMEEVEGHGGAFGSSSAQARANANLATRKGKEEPRPREEQFARWAEEAAKHGFTAEKAERLFGQERPREQPHAYENAWRDSLKEITQHEAHFTERLLIQKVCEKLQTGQATGIEIADRVRQDLSRSAEIVRLRDENADRKFTTKEMWQLEEQLLKDVETLKSRPGAIVPDLELGMTLLRNRHLDKEQADAVRTVLGESGAVRAMSGVAGSGKSTAAKAMKEGFESAGYRVIAAAQSGVAKEELASKTGIATRTLASLLFHLEKSAAERFGDRFDHVRNQIGRAAAGQSTWRRDEVRLDAKTVLFIDEASMVDNRTMARVFRLAEKSGATVVLIKDDKQLQPVEAGMPTRTIDGTVPQAHLSTNRRQQDPQDREAVQNLRDGRAAEAVKSYADRGLVTVADNRREAIENLVSTWVADGGARRPEKIAVFVPTRAEAAEVNRLCQKARLEAVRTPHVAFVRNGEERYYRDDRVMFHKPHRLHGGIENGFRGTVVSVDPVRSEIKVRLDKPPRQLEGRAPRSQTVTIPVREFGSDVSLGYASTAHKGQSQTVPAAMILVGGRNTDRELAYVEVTRASGATKWFVDRSHVGEQWKDLIAAVEKSRPKTMAHDHARSEPERPEIERQLARG